MLVEEAMDNPLLGLVCFEAEAVVLQECW